MTEHFMSDEYQEDDIQLSAIFEKYMVHWRWFALGIVICLTIAYVYLRYTIPQYQASATILVKDDKKGGIMSELSAFSDLGLGTGMKSNLDNEVEILKSRTLIERTAADLKLNVIQSSKGNFVDMELYKDSPIDVSLFSNSPTLDAKIMQFDVVNMTSVGFEIQKATIEDVPLPSLEGKKFRYGDKIFFNNTVVCVTKSALFGIENTLWDQSIHIVVSPLENIVGRYQGSLQVSPISKTSSVVVLSIVDPVTTKAEDFLNTLIKIYNEDAAADKSFISESTSKFIANRLLLISQELGEVEQDVQRFKTTNKLTDVASDAEMFLAGSNEYNKKRVDLEIQANVVASIVDFMKKSNITDLLPANIINNGGEASAMMTAYNQLVLDRNRVLKTATPENPTVIKLDQQLRALKSNIAQGLLRLQSNLNIQKRDIKGQEGLLETKIGAIPVQERQFRAIARQQKVKEELYLYLLQKREETAIALAATEPNARVIDAAKAGKRPVSPKKQMIYLAAFFLGLLIPFGIIYLIDLFDTKVKNRFDITDKFSIPFLGDVPRSDSPNQIIGTTSRTSAAEAIRIVRTNLDFMLNLVPSGKAKSVFITSTIPGEGKTFLSVNLAGIFALSGKKVLLIGMDIRSPRLNDYFGMANPKGLTDFLSTKNANVEDYINKVPNFESFDLLLAGSIPPNPTEMLMSSKVDSLFEKFKTEYDFILVDTAPVSLVSDPLIIAKYADAFVYVVRANYLDKRMLHIPNSLHKEKKLPNMALLLNDTDLTKGYGYGGYGYGGYGYGYGFETEKRSWYKKIFNR